MNEKQLIETGVFIYNYFIHEIVHSAPDNNLFYYFGGIKTGKSSFLHRLSEKFENVPVYSGYNASSIKKLTADSKKICGKGVKAILIDDLDVFTINCINSGEKGINLFKNLYEIVEKKLPGSTKIVATGRCPENLMEKISDNHLDLKGPNLLWSEILTRWHRSLLSPWMKTNWEDNLKNCFKTEIEKIIEGVSQDSLNMLFDLLIKITGGHPALWGKATAEIKSLAKMHIAGKLPKNYENLFILDKHKKKNTYDEIQKYMKEYIEFYSGIEELPVFRRTLKKINNEDDPRLTDALNILYDIAESSDGININNQPYIRDFLVKNGLVYYDVNKMKHRIPGSILIEEIKRFFKTIDISEPFYSLFSIPADNNISGKFIAKSRDRESEISLKGTEWRIFKNIFEQKGGIVSLAELKKCSGIEKDTSIRSALKRIDDKMKEGGFGSVIENVHGEGYRYHDPI